jgi:hypothetical protein
VLPAAPHHGGVQCGAKRDDADLDNAIPQRCDARTLINLSVSSRHQKNDSQKDEGSIGSYHESTTLFASSCQLSVNLSLGDLSFASTTGYRAESKVKRYFAPSPLGEIVRVRRSRAALYIPMTIYHLKGL